MAKINKSQLLGLNKNNKETEKGTAIQKEAVKKTLSDNNRFFYLLFKHKLEITPSLFIIGSLLIGILYCLVYTFIFKDIIVSVGSFIMGLLVLYTLTAADAIINRKVRDKMEFQNFIEMLQTELTATTSIPIIFNNIVKRGVHEDVEEVLKFGITEMQLGTPISETLEKCEKRTKDEYLKIVFVILRINHKLGSGETIKSLEVVKNDFKSSISNIVDAKEKMSGHIQDKNIFTMLGSVLPVIAVIYKADFFEALLSIQFGGLVLIVLMIAAFVGGIIIDKKIANVLEEI